MALKRFASFTVLVTTTRTLSSCTPYMMRSPEERAAWDQRMAPVMENWHRAIQENQVRQRQADEDEIRRLTLQQLRQQQGGRLLPKTSTTCYARPFGSGYSIDCD